MKSVEYSFWYLPGRTPGTKPYLSTYKMDAETAAQRGAIEPHLPSREVRRIPESREEQEAAMANSTGVGIMQVKRAPPAPPPPPPDPTMEPINSAPKDGSWVAGRVSQVAWYTSDRNKPHRIDGPGLIGIRWDGKEWVLADEWVNDAVLTVTHWIPPRRR